MDNENEIPLEDVVVVGIAGVRLTHAGAIDGNGILLVNDSISSIFGNY
jgi:hypothetical protein